MAAEIRKALKYIPAEKLIVSSDCGFGRQGCNREIAFYKASAIAQGCNIVRGELGFPLDLCAGDRSAVADRCGSRQKKCMKHAALLRGVNVGGKNKLPMKDLAAMFVGAGCRDVTTYIQSGNVVFSAPAAVLKKLPSTISEAIEKILWTSGAGGHSFARAVGCGDSG